MEKMHESGPEETQRRLTPEESGKLERLSKVPNLTHKELEEKSRLLLLADLRKRKSEGEAPKDKSEEKLIEGLRKTFSPEITENDINEY